MTSNDPPSGPDTRVGKRLADLRAAIHEVIVGQDRLIDGMLTALICGGHVLLEGVPGLAKTMAVKVMAGALGLEFKRISFTPDLLPADVLGTMVYHPRDAEFRPKTGPVFTNLLLADEINRAPAKVQSALLEAMQERQVTLGDRTMPLPDPFMTLATQNPLEHEGTYPLPEAQMDRFMLKCIIEYPSREDERRIMNRFARAFPEAVRPVWERADLALAREALDRVYCDEKIGDYILDIVAATRDPALFGVDAGRLIVCGASPRAVLYLHRGARATALLRGRDYTLPQDVKDIAPAVLRHRIVLSYEADAGEVTADTLITGLLEAVPVP